MKKYKDFTNFERDYKKKHKNCEYCEAMGEVRQSDVVVPRRIDELYGEAEEESLGFKWNTEKTRQLDAMFEALPQEAWLQ